MSMSGICAMRGNVMEYFKPGEYMRMMCYSVMTQACWKKKFRVLPTVVEPTTFRLLVRTLYH